MHLLILVLNFWWGESGALRLTFINHFGFWYYFGTLWQQSSILSLISFSKTFLFKGLLPTSHLSSHFCNITYVHKIWKNIWIFWFNFFFNFLVGHQRSFSCSFGLACSDGASAAPSRAPCCDSSQEWEREAIFSTMLCSQLGFASGSRDRAWASQVVWGLW